MIKTLDGYDDESRRLWGHTVFVGVLFLAFVLICILLASM